MAGKGPPVSTQESYADYVRRNRRFYEQGMMNVNAQVYVGQEPLTCDNCGAPRDSHYCNYCGTVYRKD